MLKKWLFFSLMSLSSVASAQTSLTREVTISFEGVVSRSAADSLQVRDAGGTLTSYTGALPDSSLNTGDRVAFTLNASLPTREYYDTYYTGAPAGDGLYRLSLVSSPIVGGTRGEPDIGIDYLQIFDPLRPALNFGQPTTARIGIVYDYMTDQYSLDPGVGFVAGAYQTPGFLYDASTGQLVSCNGADACRGTAGTDPVIFNLQGNPEFTTISTGNILVNSTDPNSGTGRGFFDLLFSGSWSLPVFGSSGNSGGPVSVPEPSSLLIFGMGAGAVFLRRRKRAAS